MRPRTSISVDVNDDDVKGIKLWHQLLSAGFMSAAEKKKKEKSAKKSVVNIYEVKPDELDDLAPMI